MKPGKLVVVCVCLVFLNACGGGSGGSSSSAAPVNETFGLERRESFTAPQFSVPQSVAGVVISDAFPAVSFGDQAQLVFMTALPGTNCLAVVQQRGSISSFVNDSSAAVIESFLDIFQPRAGRR